nr:biotin/lipoyl-binding protein [Massilia sp. CCM 9210]
MGRITASHVQEGQTVEAGQVLFDLSAERIGGTGSIDARIGAALNDRREQILRYRYRTHAGYRPVGPQTGADQRQLPLWRLRTVGTA